MSKKFEGEAKKLAKFMSGMAAETLANIHPGVEIGQGRSNLTAGEQKRLSPTRFDKMEKRLLKLLAGWSILDIECLLVHRVIPEAKRRATVPK